MLWVNLDTLTISLYENHSHQKSNNKTGGYVNISFIPAEEVCDDEDAFR
jgi:hypothetical protein